MEIARNKLTNPINVSFDFDSTLSRIYVQDYVKSLKNFNVIVWIVTSRHKNCKDYTYRSYKTSMECHSDLMEVSKNLDIPEGRIIFTNMEWKYLTFLGEFKPLFHVDDYSTEINYINKNTSVRGILVIKQIIG